MVSTPPINAVARAVELLQALNRQPVSTVDVLHRQTGVPKPSIIRLLQTLAAKGLVRQMLDSQSSNQADAFVPVLDHLASRDEAAYSVRRR